MKIFSTRSTIQNQEVTVLAIAETVAAMTLSGWYYFYSGTFLHFVIAAALAPVILIRTPNSNAMSISLAFEFSRYVARFVIWVGDSTEKKMNVPYAILAMIVFFISNIAAIILFFVAKLVGGSLGLLARPIETLSLIPENWRKVVLCTDTATLPEIIPGISELQDDNPRRGLRRWAIESWFKVRPNQRMTVGVLCSAALVAAPIVIPAFAYRWSIKMTALVWSPLVWAFRPLTQNKNVLVLAREIVELSIYKFGCFYAAVVILLSVSKVAIFLAWFQLTEFWWSFFNSRGIGDYLQPTEIPLWQIAAFGSACITWIMFFRSDRFLLLSDRDIADSRESFKFFLRWTTISRNFLSIYTASCALYITGNLAKSINIPALHFILFPW